MREFATISVLVMLLVTVAVGVRLLTTARRTRQWPELLFGLGFLGCGVGAGLGDLGIGFLLAEGSLLATTIKTACFALVVAGVVAFCSAVWRASGPNDVYGFLSFASAASLALVGYGMRIGAGDFVAPMQGTWGMRVFTVALISMLTWAAIEAIHLHQRLRRQVRLGLAEAVAASQIALFGVAASLGAVTTTVVGYKVLSLGRSPLDDPFTTIFVLAAVVGMSGAIWCAFFPPVALRTRSRAPSQVD